MKYRVIFVKRARNDLATIWLEATDQSNVTMAAAKIEQELTIRPLEMGESRGSSVSRTVIYPPLAYDFEVIEDDKKVRVLHVWKLG